MGRLRFHVVDRLLKGHDLITSPAFIVEVIHKPRLLWDNGPRCVYRLEQSEHLLDPFTGQPGNLAGSA